jgi:hypothetical protein
MSCPSIGLPVHLVGNAGNWTPRHEYLLDTTHHFSLRRIEVLDLTGDGVDQHVIESEFGGAGTSGSSLQVFDLSRGRFDQSLHTESVLQYEKHDWYTQTLDIGRTLQSHGRQFCCSKTIRVEKGKWFNPPRVAHPCYKRGDGVDSGEARFSSTMLSPLR